jgi:hypothetical protein
MAWSSMNLSVKLIEIEVFVDGRKRKSEHKEKPEGKRTLLEAIELSRFTRSARNSAERRRHFQ